LNGTVRDGIWAEGKRANWLDELTAKPDGTYEEPNM